jgi:hypothetical protein
MMIMMMMMTKRIAVAGAVAVALIFALFSNLSAFSAALI